MTRTLIVTGASSGIGDALTRQLVSAGTRVIAVGRNRDALALLASSSTLILPEAFDLADTAGIDAFVDKVIRAYGPIDGLINNAAVQVETRFDASGYNAADIAQEIAINLTGPIAATRAVLPHLMQQQQPIVVNVTSGLAFVPKRTSAVYSATKAGLHLFSDALRAQHHGTALCVTEAILPLVDTPMTRGRGTGKISAEYTAAQIIAAMSKRQPQVWVGKARFLRPLLRLAPSVAARIMLKV
jgi:uncharacterized oxidoreductase